MTATLSAAHTWRIRSSLRRPSRSVSVPTETLSIESRFTADARGTGSSCGSSNTSLGSSLMLVVHGAITARRSRGIATSRERTTTGRGEISGSSHHQTSPRDGRSFTMIQRPHGTTPGHPIRRVGRAAERHTRRRPHQSRPPCVAQEALPALHRSACVVDVSSKSSCLFEQSFVHRCAHSYPGHATVMPRQRYNLNQRP